MELTSQTTFLYFHDMQKARHFFDNVLKLKVVYDPVWSCVWRTGGGSFIGAVDIEKGAITVSHRGGVLVSLTVNGIEKVHAELAQSPEISGITPLKYREDLGMWSFLFAGPEGYMFEIQEFTSHELRDIF